MTRYGMVIDLSKCIGCRACLEACKVENNTPQAIFWMYVFRFESGDYPNTRTWFMPRPCMRCDNPPCVKVCPVAARFKRKDGLVLTDFDRCIGCRYCEVACPYGVNYFNWREPEKNQYLDWDDPELRKRFGGVVPPYKNPDHDKKYSEEKVGGGGLQRTVAGGGHYRGVMEKCTFCVHRLEKGLEPACVANCPTKALLFGDLDDPNSEVSQAIKNNPHFRLLEELGTEPRVYYINGQPPSDEEEQIEVVTARV